MYNTASETRGVNGTQPAHSLPEQLAWASAAGPGHYDVRVLDESISGAQATLLRKGDTWYEVALRSVNGTFVDGYRVAGERALPRLSRLFQV